MKLPAVIAWALLWLAGPTSESLLCGSAEEVKLQQRGRASAISLTLTSGDYHEASEPCSLNIFAPHVYALSLRLIDAEDPFADFGKTFSPKWGNRKVSDKSETADKKNKTVPNCTLNVFYIDVNESATIPVWKVVPCSAEFSIQNSSPQLMSPPIKIEWWPPLGHRRTDNLRLIITAVNSGETCLEKDQITCLRAGLEPLLCVSDALACDGVKHCPAGSRGDDEAHSLCESRNSNWVQELLKRLASKHGELLGIEMITSRPSNSTTKRVVEIAKEKTKRRTGLGALDAALEPYGTWGYLLLGMLICATVLILFGVWECFCHYSRTPEDTSMPPDCIAPSAICSAYPQNWRPYPPPNYDELEPPPPSYNVLFPQSDKVVEVPSTSTPEVITENAPSA